MRNITIKGEENESRVLIGGEEKQRFEWGEMVKTP